MKLIAIKEMRYGGATHLPGAVFEARSDDALVLKAIQYAKDVTREDDKPVVAAKPEQKKPVELATMAETPMVAPRSKGRYPRRDMRAEE